jgi:hypothetical protein
MVDEMAGWTGLFGYGGQCSCCFVTQESSGGARAHGGTHICEAALKQWASDATDEEREKMTFMDLLDLQWRSVAS